MKKIPLRTCVVTGEKLEKKDLIRVVRTPNMEVIVDDTGKANGKGAYLKREIDIINKAEKTKILNKKLEVEVPKEIYDKLRSRCNYEEK